MNVFVILNIIVLFLALLIYTGHRIEKRDAIFLVISFLVLYIVHAFKDPNTLKDTPYYLEGFKEVTHTDFNVLWNNGFKLKILKTEEGYVVFNKLVSIISSYSQMIFFTTSFVILIGYFIAFKRYSPIVWLSVLLFLIGSFNMSLFVLRQFMAMSIIMFSYPFIINRKLYQFLLVVLLAFSFHQTAIIFLPVYFLYGIKGERKIYTIVIISGAILTIIMGLLLNYSMSYLKGYGSYVNTDSEGTNMKMSLMLVAILIFRLKTLKHDFLQMGIERLLSILLLIGTIISIAGIGFVPTGRLNMYYTSALCLIIPSTLMNVASSYLRWLYLCMYVLFQYFFYFKNLDDLAQRFQFI